MAKQLNLVGDVWTALLLVLILITADTLLGVIQALGRGNLMTRRNEN